MSQFNKYNFLNALLIVPIWFLIFLMVSFFSEKEAHKDILTENQCIWSVDLFYPHLPDGCLDKFEEFSCKDAIKKTSKDNLLAICLKYLYGYNN